MKNILDITQAIETSKTLKQEGKQIVLVGGCFDILHPGHIQFLQQAKAAGDTLFIFLESDEKITHLKGETRPLHTQVERAAMLIALRFVDYVILLPYFSENKQYAELLQQIRPGIIATTEGDPKLANKKKQAEQIGARVIEVTKYIPNKSTTRLLKVLTDEI